MEEWLNNPYIHIIAKISCAEEYQIRKWLEELEDELRTKNRYFPQNKILNCIDTLCENSYRIIKKGTVLYRARTINKYQENRLFESFMEDAERLIKKKVPDFNVHGSDYEWIKVQTNMNIESNGKDWNQEILGALYSKYGRLSWWGYDEKGSDAAPSPGAGRINPEGISYLYAADNIKTASLEVRPVISQYLSIAEIEATEDINLFDFSKKYDGSDEFQKNWDNAIRMSVLSEYFSNPNYSGEAAYLATQYISEYIKNKNRKDGSSIFDGLCFKSSLDRDGLNYVLFDVSKDRKYKINNSSIFQMMSLNGDLQRILPLPALEDLKEI